jgi:chromosome segregation ATPase
MKKQTSPELTEVYESGVAVVESIAEEKVRLTAEIAELDEQWESVKTKLVPSPHTPGMDYAPAKRKLSLEIEIVERRIRLGEIQHKEAQAEAERMRAEVVEAATTTVTEREALAKRIKSMEIELANLRIEQQRAGNSEFSQREAIRNADRVVSRVAGELEYWRNLLPKTR